MNSNFIKKVYTFYKNRGLANTLDQIFKSFLLRIGLSIKLHPKKLIVNLAKARKIFNNRNLEFNSNGFWYLSPMPTEQELDEYYKLSYWDSWQPSFCGIEIRDIRHYLILIKFDLKFNEKKKKILNFGAGHGGISIIFNILGHDVTNIEPSGMNNLFESNWKSFTNINNLHGEKFDLIYGSHSLEHINNLDIFNKKIKTLSTNNTLFFWEVPNADHQYSGTKENRIDIPHTYYFKKEYFKFLYNRIILLNCYNSIKANQLPPFKFQDSFQEDGDTIIVLAKY